MGTSKKKPTARQIESMDNYLEAIRIIQTTNTAPCQGAWYTMVEYIENIREKYDWYDLEFEQDGLKGLKNIKGEVTVPALYDEILDHWAYYVDDGTLVRVCKDGKMGLVKRDGKGTPMSALEFDMITPIEASQAFKVWKDGDNSHFAIWADGKPVTPFILDASSEDCIAGLVLIGAKGKKGILVLGDTTLYVTPEYDEVEPLNDTGYTIFTKDGVEGYVTLDNRFIPIHDYDLMIGAVRDELEEVGFVWTACE